MKFTAKTKPLLTVLALLLLTLNIQCKSEKDPIPYVYVDIRISLNTPDFYPLNAIGNSVFVTGGYKGIVIFRKSIDEFLAFDRACTFDPDCERLELDDTHTKLVHTNCCNSEYSLLLDGHPVHEPAKMPLKRYKVVYYEGLNSLEITNEF